VFNENKFVIPSLLDSILEIELSDEWIELAVEVKRKYKDPDEEFDSSKF